MKKIDFNKGWTFHKQGKESEAVTVNLPHDAMIHEERDPKSKGGGAIAFFPGGTYVYEKTFDVPADWKEKYIAFEFGGIYKNSKIYLNDVEVGGRPYGYSPFSVQADQYLRWGGQNTIRVIADNSQIPNSRWYSGSGIYRPVHLIVANNPHIELNGVKVSTLAYSPAKILVETAATGGEVSIEILDGAAVVATGKGSSVEFNIDGAKLWSANRPNLYTCHVLLHENGKVIDEQTVSFGIRKVEWNKSGLFVNGKNVLLRGGCIHHDNGVLGSCAYDQAEERRVRIMKEAGFNAIRSAHNPTSAALLEACDRYGMYVMDETFDMWYKLKTKYDYAADFDEWHLEDIKGMVERDFNHPSVIMYSIGNEVGEPAEDRGMALTREMVDYIHQLDPSRAVTGGMNLMIINMASKGKSFFNQEEGGLNMEESPEEEKKQKKASSTLFNMMTSVMGPFMNKMTNSNHADKVTSPCLDTLDIAGYNYASGRYKLEGKKHPDRVILGSETFPFDIAKNWAMVKKYPYLVGDFMWTGWDYLGEVGIGAWVYGKGAGGFFKPYPWLLANTGVIDILGNIGAEAKYAATVWGLEEKPYIAVRPVSHSGERVSKAMWRGTDAINSWSWKDCEGRKAQVEVYSDADKVELCVNGKSLGKKRLKNFKTMFKTEYAPGTIKAIAYDIDGNSLSESELVSAVGQTRISLEPEIAELEKDGIVFVNVDLVGENGIVQSNDDRKLSVGVEGGKLLDFGSANPSTEERFNSGTYITYYGKALAVAQADGLGDLIIRVSGEGLEPAEVSIPVIE